MFWFSTENHSVVGWGQQLDHVHPRQLWRRSIGGVLRGGRRVRLRETKLAARLAVVARRWQNVAHSLSRAIARLHVAVLWLWAWVVRTHKRMAGDVDCVCFVCDSSVDKPLLVCAFSLWSG